ncbi:MAG TPA: TolC family protein [Granulicella sp.]|jgi:outer membrane protein TolC|nr:TolC family protein [Granulicella sp.]
MRNNDGVATHGEYSRKWSNGAWASLVLIAFAACLLPANAQAPAGESVGARPAVHLTLSRAVEMGMQHNRHLTLARLAADESREKRAIAQAPYYPHIANESNALYLTDLEGVVFPAGAFGYSASTGLIPNQTLRIGQGAQDAFTSGTGLVQPITQIFKIHAGSKAAEADVKTAEIAEKDSENSISLLVHKLYFAMLTAGARLSAAKQSVAAASIVEQESIRAVADGRSLEVDTLEDHATLLDQQQSVLKVQLSLDDLTLQLDDALGLPLGTKLILDPNIDADSPTLPSRSEAIAMARDRNPKVLEAQQSVEKAKAGLAAARAAYIPDISGLARYSYQSGVPFLVHSFGTFGGNLSYDLFDGGAREFRLKQAKIQLEMARTQLDQTVADIAIEISAAYDQVDELHQLVAVASEALKARMEAARISVQRQQQNAELPSGVAKSQAVVSAANASLLEAQLGLYLAENSIQQMLGVRP